MRASVRASAIWQVRVVLLSVAAYAAQAAEGATNRTVYVHRNNHAITLGNPAIELVFQQTDDSCRLTGVVNKLAGRTHALTCDDFAIEIKGREKPLVAADFKFKNAVDKATVGGRRLTFLLDGKTPGTSLEIVYELNGRDFFARRRLEVTSDKRLSLRRVDVWLAGIQDGCLHQGFGEPVLLRDTFWGLEYPAGHNQYENGRVWLTQWPGRDVSGTFQSKTAVVGVAEAGRVASRFRQYVESFQATPKNRNLFVNYNTWWTLMPPDEKSCLALIELFRQKLFAPYGESFDTFTIDDGWDNKDSIWAIRTSSFPRGFVPLVDALKKMNAQLGLWLSPSSGYGHAPWGAKNGYELNSGKWGLCQSGPNYRRAIVPVVASLARTYGLAFYKFDGFVAGCETAGHGHLLGDYSREANVDAYLELLSAVRSVRKDIFLDPTCGMWLSPWWLKYVDSIWGDVSGDYPDVIVPAATARQSATTTRDGAFRQRCREHPGFPPVAIEHLGIIVITPEPWEDNAMIVLGRGCRLLTLYIDPKMFHKGDRDWAFLASILKWARHNTATLAHTELILGDPMHREPYGYAHFAGPRGIIALRNPFIEPRKLAIRLDESCGWDGREARDYQARVVYPRHEVLAQRLANGSALELELQGYETVLIHIEPCDALSPELLATPYEEVSRQGNKITYEVYRRPHSDQPCSVEGGKLETASAEGGWKIAGACIARVPRGTTATMHVLFDPIQSRPGVAMCTAQVAGKLVTVRALRSPEKPEQAHSPHVWTWFEFDVPEGQNQVTITIEPGGAADAKQFFRGEIGWWLWGEHRLTKQTFVHEYPDRLPAARNEPLPLPISQDRQRQITTIRPAGVVRAGNRWPGLDRPTIHLDEVTPDLCTQDWGQLQRNRSVWEKEMIVAGRKFAHGLGTHANSRIAYELSGGRFKSFHCLVGRDEHAMDGQIMFQVWVDGKKRFDSGPMSKSTPAKPVEVDLAGAAVLELRTLTGEDGQNGDHGDWAEAELTR
jgi:hypothetical protein